MTLRLLAAAASVFALAAGAAGATSQAGDVRATAGAFAVKIVVPAQAGAAATEVAAPPAAADALDSFAYPADGSIVRTGAVSSSVATRPVDGAGAQAVTDVLGLTLFGGELTAASVAARANAVVTGTGAAADAAGSGVVGLTVSGKPVVAAPNAQVPLGDWGYAVLLEGSAERTQAGRLASGRAVVVAIHVYLTQAHGGLPEGSEIMIGSAEAVAQAPVSAGAKAEPAESGATATTPAAAARPKAPRPPRKAPPKAPRPKRLPGPPGPLARPPLDVLPQLTASGYVFPVYGPTSFVDTFGAPRAGGQWHRGEDLFAPLGTPVLAAAAGTVFSVGWNDVGGYRLWLRDRQGNQFYYAHLSAFSPLAVNGNEVRAGDVLGFVGNTGDAQRTPYHLHFEIHPVAMLGLGYDGVVNAYPYLLAWQRLQDVSFGPGRGWAPPTPPGARAPRPGAVLLQATDISTASGLDPASLERALAAPVSPEGDGAPVRRS